MERKAYRPVVNIYPVRFDVSETRSQRILLCEMIIAALIRQSGEVEASAEVMADMNELVKAPELTKAVQKMARQLQKVCTALVIECRYATDCK